MLNNLMRKLGLIRPAINTAILAVASKELRTLTQDRDNFVEMVHPDGYKSRHRVLLTICSGNGFKYKRDCRDYWDHINQLVAGKLPGKLNRLCIAGHLYRL